MKQAFSFSFSLSLSLYLNDLFTWPEQDRKQRLAFKWDNEALALFLLTECNCKLASSCVLYVTLTPIKEVGVVFFVSLFLSQFSAGKFYCCYSCCSGSSSCCCYWSCCSCWVVIRLECVLFRFVNAFVRPFIFVANCFILTIDQNKQTNKQTSE